MITKCYITFIIPAFLDAFLGKPLDMDLDLNLPRLAVSPPATPFPMSASSSPHPSSTCVVKLISWIFPSSTLLFINCVRSLRLSRRLLNWVRSEYLGSWKKN